MNRFTPHEIAELLDHPQHRGHGIREAEPLPDHFFAENEQVIMARVKQLQQAKSPRSSLQRLIYAAASFLAIVAAAVSISLYRAPQTESTIALASIADDLPCGLYELSADAEESETQVLEDLAESDLFLDNLY